MLFVIYCLICWYLSVLLQRVDYNNLNGILVERVKDVLYDRNIIFHDWI